MGAPSWEVALVTLLLVHASGETFVVAPVRTSETCTRGYAICDYELYCPEKYALECQDVSCEASQQDCTDLGVNFRPSEWNGHCDDWPDDVEKRLQCCQCVGSEPLAATTSPTSSGPLCYRTGDKCPTSFQIACCRDELSCPDGYQLSTSVSLCGVSACDRLGSAYAASEVVYESGQCMDVYAQDETLCNTCVKISTGELITQVPSSTEPSSTTLAPVTLELTTSLQGASTSAALGSDYTAPTQSGEFCMTDGYVICEYPLSCPVGYALQCQGLACEAKEKTCSDLGNSFAAKRWTGQCDGHWPDAGAVHRYECCRCARTPPSDAGWEYVGSRGRAACRGRNSSDNAPGYYTVHTGITDLEVCMSLCVQQFPSCKGIEFSMGRCEIWTRPEGISAWAELNISGFTCMRFGRPTGNLLPVDGGVGRACRGDEPGDNSDDYYQVVALETLEECSAACSAAPLCDGIEFSLGRCEIWRRPIRASLVLANFTCLAYSPEAFSLPHYAEKEPILFP